ncbi:MAG: hypothetical protein HQ541_06170 [Mariniphaga sp.]|nr:hypothetical protein [Mariniphaga sp.]
MANTIRRNLALKEYDIKEDPNGKQIIFSIRFVKKDGEIVFLPRAVACGLPFNLKENRMRGVVAVDEELNKIGHPYPVSIDGIIQWNNQKVIL